MSPTLILWPVLVQIGLTFSILVVLGARKHTAVAGGQIDPARTALHNDAWPDEVLKASNNLQNQFQTPVLFYVLCLGFLLSESVSIMTLGIAWGWAISRIVHAYVHLGSNFVPRRFQAFLVGLVLLLALGVLLAIEIA